MHCGALVDHVAFAFSDGSCVEYGGAGGTEQVGSAALRRPTRGGDVSWHVCLMKCVPYVIYASYHVGAGQPPFVLAEGEELVAVLGRQVTTRATCHLPAPHPVPPPPRLCAAST